MSLFLVCMCTVAVAAGAAEMRTWTDSTGQYRIEAAFVSEAGGTVTLERKDGRQLPIPLERLSEADRKYVADQKAAAMENPFKIAGEDAPAEAAAGQPRVVEVDWTGAREVAPEATRPGWTFDAPAARSQPQPDGYKPVAFPRIGFKYEAITTSAPSNRVLLSFARRDKEKYPDENNQIVCRYVLADMASGQIKSYEVGPLDSTLLARAMNEEGTRAIVRRSAWGFGKHDRLEHWEFTASGVKRLLQWIPHSTATGANRDVKWVEYLNGDRAVTVGGSGRLAVWDLNSGKIIYHFATKGGAVPCISPDRRYICYARGSGIGVLDVDKGEVVAAQQVGRSLTWPTFFFNPTGTKVACLDHTRLLVWSFLDGELLVDIPRRGFPGGGFRFVSENHLLLTGQVLFDIANQLQVWTYQGAASAENFGDYCCFVAEGTSGNSGLIIPERLPQQTVTDTLNKAMKDPEFWVLTEGTTVRLDVEGIPNEQRDTIREQLTEKLNNQGCKVGSQGTIDLVVSVKESEKPKQVSYGQAFGPFARGAVPFNVREFISRAEFVYQGETAWELTGTNVPTRFSLKDGEAITDALKRHEKPNYAWFERLELPAVLRKPSGSPSLGTTKITADGLQ